MIWKDFRRDWERAHYITVLYSPHFKGHQPYEYSISKVLKPPTLLTDNSIPAASDIITHFPAALGSQTMAEAPL